MTFYDVEVIKTHMWKSVDALDSPRPKSARSKPKSARSQAKSAAKQSEDMDIFDVEDSHKR